MTPESFSPADPLITTLVCPSLEERLERGEIVVFPTAPFPLPEGEERTFLLDQQLSPLIHKNISCDPTAGRVTGHVRHSTHDDERLRTMLLDFSRQATGWLASVLPRYRSGIDLDRVSYRPLEEATRRLRPTARNDLLHIDAFPNRPSRGRRLLRLFANLNPSEPRVWVTSEPFARLLERYGPATGLPGWSSRWGGSGWLMELGANVLGILRGPDARHSAYDLFMLRFHDYLKTHQEFQERCPKKLWSFPPGSVWLVMTDGCSYAELRGRYALEHSFFVQPEVLALPDEAPAALLARLSARVQAGRHDGQAA